MLYFCLIVLFSASLRLVNLDLIEFKTDEAVNLFLSSRPFFGEPFPPGGTVSSIGLLNPPFFNYLLFLLANFSLDPRSVSFLIALLNSLSIGFFFLIIKKYYSFKIALISSLFLAVSPWMILFSRKIWAQDFIFPLALPLFLSLHKIILEKGKKSWFIFGLFLFLLLQLHQALLFFLLPLTLWLLVKYGKNGFSYFSLGSLLALLPLLSYLVYIWANFITNNLDAFLVSKQYFSPVFSPELFLRPFQIVGQGNFQFVLGSDMLTLAKNFPLLYKLRPLFYLEYLLLALGFFLFWQKYPALRNFLYFSLLLPLFYFFFHIEPFMHYFLILTPFLFLCLGIAFAYFLDCKSKLVSYTAIVILFFLVILSLSFQNSIQELLIKQGGFRGDYGTAFLVLKKINEEKFLLKKQTGRNYEEQLIVSFIPEEMLCNTTLPVARMIYPSTVQKSFCP